MPNEVGSLPQWSRTYGFVPSAPIVNILVRKERSFGPCQGCRKMKRDAGVFGRQNLHIGIRDPGVTIAGTGVMQPPKTRSSKERKKTYASWNRLRNVRLPESICALSVSRVGKSSGKVSRLGLPNPMIQETCPQPEVCFSNARRGQGLPR
jgi:hypothetical protein